MAWESTVISWFLDQELGVLTAAMYHARELAMTRLEEEAGRY